MFANSQMMGVDMGFPGTALSPLRLFGQMARRTNDPQTLKLIRAGLEAMVKESRESNVFSQDRLVAETDLRYIDSKIGPSR